MPKAMAKLTWQLAWDMLLDEDYGGCGSRPDTIPPEELQSTYGSVFVETITRELRTFGSNRRFCSWSLRLFLTGIACISFHCRAAAAAEQRLLELSGRSNGRFVAQITVWKLRGSAEVWPDQARESCCCCATPCGTGDDSGELYTRATRYTTQPAACDVAE